MGKKETRGYFLSGWIPCFQNASTESENRLLMLSTNIDVMVNS